ncbi:MAG: metal-sensitive transcriptional regulator [Patescibacteria group bacterium]
MAYKKPSSPRQDVSRRLKIVAGHLNKVIEMVDEGIYCIDILQQTSAVRSAIKRAEEVLLINHLNSCVVSALKSGANKKTADELASVFRKLD